MAALQTYQSLTIKSLENKKFQLFCICFLLGNSQQNGSNCNKIINKVIFLTKQIIYDFIVAQSFLIVNLWSSLWIKTWCKPSLYHRSSQPNSCQYPFINYFEYQKQFVSIRLVADGEMILSGERADQSAGGGSSADGWVRGPTRALRLVLAGPVTGRGHGGAGWPLKKL